MTQDKYPFIYAVYDRTDLGKGSKPFSLHYSEGGALERVTERQIGISEKAKPLVYYETIPVED